MYQVFFGGGAEAASTTARWTQWEQGLPYILKNPVLGYGVRQGAIVLNFRNPAGERTIDSYWLSLLLDTGVVGFVAFMGFFYIVIRLCAKLYVETSNIKNSSARFGAAIASSLAAFIVIKLVLSQASNHGLVFVIAGFGMAMILTVKREMKLENSNSKT